MKQPVQHTSLIKSMHILEVLIEGGEMGVSDIGRKMGLNRSNVHRILNTFEFLRYVEKNSENNRYRPSLRVFELGSMIVQKSGLVKTAHPFLERLGSKFGETNNLSVLDKGEVVFIDKIESSEVLRTDLAIGRRVPAYCTALGKVLLTALTPEQLNQYISETKFIRKTPNTISSKKEFRSRLAQVRDRGFAIDNEELHLGIRCIAAPIRNYSGDVVAAISVAGPATRMTFEKIEDIRKTILTMAMNISGRFAL